MCCPSAVAVSVRSFVAVHGAMLGGRDILEEHSERLESRKRARAIGPTEAAAPPNSAQLLGATQVYLVFVEYKETDAVIFVEVKDELTDKILGQGDATKRREAGVVPWGLLQDGPVLEGRPRVEIDVYPEGPQQADDVVPL